MCEWFRITHIHQFAGTGELELSAALLEDAMSDGITKSLMLRRCATKHELSLLQASDGARQSIIHGARLSVVMKNPKNVDGKWCYAFEVCIGQITVHEIKGRYSELRKQHAKHATTLGCADELMFPEPDRFMSLAKKVSDHLERQGIESRQREMKKYFESVVDIYGRFDREAVRKVHRDMGVPDDISEKMLEAAPLRIVRWSRSVSVTVFANLICELLKLHCVSVVSRAIFSRVSHRIHPFEVGMKEKL